MPPLPYTLLDVFTDVPLAGNALAVVHDADALDDATMLAFARETRLSETTFVVRAGDPRADYGNRIFTVREEIPFAGHPSLGTAVAVARRQGARAARYIQRTGAGNQAIEVRRGAGPLGHASMLQAAATFGAEPPVEAALGAVGLPAGAAHARLAPRVASTGLPTLIVPVGAADALAHARLDPAALESVLARAGAYTLYLVWPDEQLGDFARARAFTPAVAGGEDPATGSAAGPLAADLADRLGWSGVEIAQGVELGRPSRLVAEHLAEGVRVAGDVVVLVEGTLTL